MRLYQRGGFFPVIDYRQASYAKQAPRTKHHIRSFVVACQRMFRFITETVSLTNQVGPFRIPPERRYSGGVGSKGAPDGEQAVSLLITEALLRPTGPRHLHRNVSFWLKKLGLATSLDLRDLAKRLNLFEVDIRGARRGTSANLTDVGFGISQILPVIVQGLLMNEGGIYIVQQPEIHLHPDAQAALADFFIYLTSRGVITIIETHSEYLLLRIRRRLAEAGKSLQKGLPRRSLHRFNPEGVSVLLTGFEHTESKVRELEINESFQFTNMPPGFMSQALEDRMALLKAIGSRNA
jgi:predicted ATPase